MLKRVKFNTYQVLKAIYKRNIKIITASDTEAVIFIQR